MSLFDDRMKYVNDRLERGWGLMWAISSALPEIAVFWFFLGLIFGVTGSVLL